MSDAVDRWRRVDALCQAALAVPTAERSAFLRASGEDDAVRDEAQTLFAQAPQADAFLESPLGTAVAVVLADAPPALSGTRVGAFEVGALLGSGGMGEAYRAFDTRLERHVALKVLPLVFALDPVRVERFRREAQALASLNHPNIAAIYGFEDADGVQALVLELVEGVTLAERLDLGPLSLAEALPIALQMAQALEAAHEAGIVHNDFKPSNVKLRPDGAVKVLDFGLATVMRAIGPTSASPGAADTGVTFATPAYASPEQMKGIADKRSDIWAFGAVLYEMLAGRPPFSGVSSDGACTAVDWSALPPSTPQPLHRLIARCLEPDVRQRLRDIGEARIALEAFCAVPPTRSEDERWIAEHRRARRRGAMRWLSVGAVAAAMAAAIFIAGRSSTSSPTAVVRLSLTFPDGQTLSTGDRSVAAISADGTQVVYAAAPAGLYVRPLSRAEAKPIPGIEGDVNVGEPAFSPDGQSIVFHSMADQTLKRIPVAGGAPVTLCRATFASGVSWTKDGIVFVEPGRGIERVDPGGGQPTLLVPLDANQSAQGPRLLPGGEWLLYTLTTSSAPDRWDHARIVARSLTSGRQVTLVEGGSDARYVATGHLIYAVSGNLFAVPIDLPRMRVAGTPTSVLQGVRRGASPVSGAAQFGIADNGTLMFVPGAASDMWDLAVIDPKGPSERLPLPPGRYETPRVSPDGKRIAFGTDDGKEAVVWVYDIGSAAAPRRLTFGGNARFPIWSGDGRRIAFQSDRDGDAAIFSQTLTGAAQERLTKPDVGEAHEPESWSPTDDVIVFTSRRQDDFTLWTLGLRSGTASRFGDVHSSTRTGAAFSPDGRWIAYARSNDLGKTVYVEPFPRTGVKYQLATPGVKQPNHPLWSPDGKRLFYNPGPGRFEAVPVTAAPVFAFGNPVVMPRFFPGASTQTRRPFDILPDGRFVSPVSPGVTSAGGVVRQEIRIVLNWIAELEGTRKH